jgi:hypothetical protein
MELDVPHIFAPYISNFRDLPEADRLRDYIDAADSVPPKPLLIFRTAEKTCLDGKVVEICGKVLTQQAIDELLLPEGWLDTYPHMFDGDLASLPSDDKNIRYFRPNLFRKVYNSISSEELNVNEIVEVLIGMGYLGVESRASNPLHILVEPCDREEARHVHEFSQVTPCTDHEYDQVIKAWEVYKSKTI